MIPVKRLILIFITFTAVFASTISAQIIITGGTDQSPASLESSIVWEFKTSDRIFAAIEQSSFPASFE